MSIVFPSISHSDKRGYILHDSHADLFDQVWRNRGRFISEKLGKYDTYGDGLVQHSHEIACIIEDWSDCLFSLADYCLKEREKAGQVVAGMMRNYSVSADKMRFALTVVYKEGKRRYFSTSEGEVTARASAEHDKRFTLLEPRHNGGFDSACEVMGIGKTGDMLTVYHEYNLAKDLYYQLTGHSGSLPSFGDFEERAGEQANQAYWAIRHIGNAYEALDYAQRAISNMRDSLPKPADCA